MLRNIRNILKAVLALGIIVTVFFFLYKVVCSRTFQFFGEIINRVETDEKVVALTFDDGPTKNTDLGY